MSRIRGKGLTEMTFEDIESAGKNSVEHAIALLKGMEESRVDSPRVSAGAYFAAVIMLQHHDTRNSSRAFLKKMEAMRGQKMTIDKISSINNEMLAVYIASIGVCALEMYMKQHGLINDADILEVDDNIYEDDE